MGGSSSSTVEELPPQNDASVPEDINDPIDNNEADPAQHFMQSIPAFVARPEPVPKQEWPPAVKSHASDYHDRRILESQRRVQSMGHSKPDVSNAASHIQVGQLKDVLDPELHSQFLHKRPGWKKFNEAAKKGSKALHDKVTADAQEHGVPLEQPESLTKEEALDKKSVAKYFRGERDSDEEVADLDDFTEQEGQDALADLEFSGAPAEDGD